MTITLNNVCEPHGIITYVSLPHMRYKSDFGPHTEMPKIWFLCPQSPENDQIGVTSTEKIRFKSLPDDVNIAWHNAMLVRGLEVWLSYSCTSALVMQESLGCAWTSLFQSRSCESIDRRDRLIRLIEIFTTLAAADQPAGFLHCFLCVCPHVMSQPTRHIVA